MKLAGRATAAFLFLAASPALACRCAQTTYEQVIATTPVVFDGEIVRIESDASGERQITTFRVRGAVKGVSKRAVLRLETVLKRLPQRTITILSQVNGPACGWDFSAGPRRLLVGATRDDDGNLVATRCTMYNLNRRP